MCKEGKSQLYGLECCRVDGLSKLCPSGIVAPKMPSPERILTEIVIELYPTLLAAAWKVVNIYTGWQGAIESYQIEPYQAMAKLTVALDELRKVVENES